LETVAVPAPTRYWAAEESANRAVYFMQANGGGPIKIGSTVNPDKRLKQMQTHQPEEIVIRRLVWVDAEIGYALETALRRAFGYAQMRGEWFRPTPRLARLARAMPGEGLTDPAPQSRIGPPPRTGEQRLAAAIGL
jgi:hypothetical protein